MKQSTIVKLYEILDQLNIAGVKPETQKAVLKNIRLFKPVYDAYVEEVKTVRDKLKPADFDEIEQKANRHNEALKAGTDDGRLSQEEVAEVSAIYDSYNEAMRLYIEELNETDIACEALLVEEDEYYKLVNQNDSKVDAGKLALLMDLIREDFVA